MEKYDIFIQAGQSNAEGFGRGEISVPFVPDDRICYLTKPAVIPYAIGTPLGSPDIYNRNDPCTIMVAQERKDDSCGENDRLGDFSLTFAKEYIQAGLLAPDRKLLIIRCAVGGTGFVYNQWEMDAPLYTRMLDMTDYALALNPENRLMGMLWHQGEHDAYEGNPPARYKKQVLEMIDSVRNRYGSPNLPFICGGFCYEWVQQYLKNATEIMQMLREIAAERDGIYIETDDLLSNHEKTGENGIGDDVHFCRDSLYVMGCRYFDAYQKIIRRRNGLDTF